MFDQEAAVEKRKETFEQEQERAIQNAIDAVKKHRKDTLMKIATLAQSVNREIAGEPVNAKNCTIFNYSKDIENLASQLLLKELEG